MTFPKALFAASCAANVACAAALVLRPGLAPPAVREFFHRSDREAEVRFAREAQLRATAASAVSASAVANHPLHWSTLDSTDLKTLVANLRTGGFSPAQIRAVVHVRLEARFADGFRKITDTPYWKPNAGPCNSSNPQVLEDMGRLGREQTRLLREILDDDFFAGSSVEDDAEQRRQFGHLPKAKIAAIQRLDDDYSEMVAQVHTSMRGIRLPEDLRKLALLKAEKHADLVALLSPDELRDYDARNSMVAMRLRPALSVMDSTEEEFSVISTLLEPLADRLYPDDLADPASARVRAEAEELADRQLAAALGPARAADYLRAFSVDYLDLHRIAQDENLPAAAAARAFDLRNATAVEARRISADQALSDTEKLAALRTLAQSTRAGLIAVLGSKAGDTYLQSADWLPHIEGGGTVTFNNDGESRLHPFSPAVPPAK